MKRHIYILALTALMSLLILAAGCGGNKPAEAPKADAPKKDVKPVEFKMHHHDPPNSPIGKALDEWAKEVGEKTGGRVKVTVYPAGTLGDATSSYGMVIDGVVDIAWGSTGLYPGRFPLTDTVRLPMMGMKNAVVGSKVVWELYKSSDFMKKEWGETRVLAIHTHGGCPLGTRKPVNTMADLKGMKIRTLAGGPTEMLKRMGAVPVVIPPKELYQQVEKGILDGWTIDWQGVLGFKLGEVTPYVLETEKNIYVTPMFIVMNKKSYEKMSEEDRKIFDSITGDYLSEKMAKACDGAEEPGKKSVTDAGNKVVKLSAEEEAKWVKVCDEIANDYAKELDAKGMAGTEALKKVRQLVETYRK